MKSSHFWYFTMVAMLCVANANGWTVPLRIAVIANSVLVLFQCGRRIWDEYHGEPD